MRKKILVMLLPVILTAATLFAFPGSRAFASITVKAYGNGERTAIQTDVGDGSLGQRVHVNGEFVGFSFNMPSWNTTDSTATVGIFKWNNDFDTTVEAGPLYSKDFVIKDNQAHTVRFNDDPQPAGEYLFLIYNASGSAGCWVIMDNSVSKGFCYQNGLEQEWDMELSIIFTSRSSEPFLECETADNAYVSVKPPKEYVIPENSLINTHEVMPDTWVFTDGLGRVSLTNAEVGDPKTDKTVALFYWTWHNNARLSLMPFNNQIFSEEHPEAKYDYDNPLWPKSAGHWWNESINGYYVGTDEWVLRRHAELLANAGIDTIFTDNTNGTATWRECYLKLYETWGKAMDDGVKTPKVSFMLPFSASSDARTQLQMLFTDIYYPKKFQKLWFYWEGKPMLMGWPGKLQLSEQLDNNIMNYFTFRNNIPEYIALQEHLDLNGAWGWLSMYPQAYYYANDEDRAAGKIEQVTVGVAQNHNYKTHELSAMNGPYNAGRSYTLDESHLGTENSKLYGYNFAEQWDYALTLDPKVIFVTGWNEWTAGRYEEWGGVKNAFPDQYDDENSRDIEPSKGDLKDHYYYQLVNYVRKYKGARPIPVPGNPVAITLGAGENEWQNVTPYYAAYIGNTGDRDALGYGRTVYQEFSGRNDIIGARLARDNDYFYFRVECNDDITPYTDNLWMNLLIDSDQTAQGWNTFDFVVNKSPASADTVVLERFTGDGYASEKVADCEYKVDGKYMTVKILKSDVGVSGKDYTVNFAWTDNVHDEADKGVQNADGSWTYSDYSGDIMDFYISGDVAPGGRFKYSFAVSNDKELDENGNVIEQKAGLNPVLIIVPVAVALTAAAVATVVTVKSRKNKQA